jgi:DNA modification methylase
MDIRDRVRDFRRVPASTIRPSPFNWRTHPKEQADALRGLLAELGFAGAVLARELPDGSLEAIDGHLRLETMGDRPVPVLVTDLDEAEARKLLATFDPLGAMAGADADKLQALLDDVQTGNDAVAALLDSVAHDAGVEWGVAETTPGGGGDEFDPTAEADGPTRTSPGDLWVIGGKHRLLVGDCTILDNVGRLTGGVAAEMMFADPPYGVSYTGKTSDALTLDNDQTEDLPRLLRGAFAGALSAVRGGGAWYVCAPAGPQHWEFARQLLELGVYRQTLVWVKDQFVLGHSDYHYRHEPLFYGWTPGGERHPPPTRDQDSVWQIDRPRRSSEHPTTKPVALVEKAVANSSDPGHVVYDPFLGSGTTLVASHRLGRVCHGCEVEPRYADVVLRRAEAEGLSCEKVG